VTSVAPSIETVARCDGASSLAVAGYLSFGLSANLALSERYAAVAVKGKQGVRVYPQAGYLRLISLRISSSNPQGQAEPSDGLGRDAHSQCGPGFLWRSADRGAAFLQHLSCSVSHQFLDFIPVKTVVSADPKSGNQTVASQSVHRGQANVQIVGYFGNRHEARGRGVVAGLLDRIS
jgi:hypothetical protein